jgi:cell division protein FtsB
MNEPTAQLLTAICALTGSLCTSIIGLVGVCVTAYLAYLMAKLRGGQAAAAVKVDEAAVKVDEVKKALQETTTSQAQKIEEVRTIVDGQRTAMIAEIADLKALLLAKDRPAAK